MFRIDSLFLLSLLFSILVATPVSIKAFSVGNQYIAEIPIVFFLVCAFILGYRVKPRIFRRVLLTSLLVTAVLIPFLLIGVFGRAKLSDAYSDMRAIVLLSSATVLLLNISKEIAKRFVLLTIMFTILIYFLIFILNFEEVFYPGFGIQHGKIVLPIFSFVAISTYFAYRNKVLLAVILILFGFLTMQTGYRHVYIVYIAALFAICFVILINSKILATPWKYLFILVISTYYIKVFLTWEKYVYLLFDIQYYAYKIGINKILIDQLITKSIHSILGNMQAGDTTYLLYAKSMFDFNRFIFPHGLGHEASLGDPTIFGGNSMDNTIIFFNYHFSIWITILFLSFLIAIGLRLCKNLTRIDSITLLSAAVPSGLALFFRPIPFTSIAGAFDFSFFIFIYSYIAQMIKNK